MSKETFLVVDDSRLSRVILSSLVGTARPDWNIIEAVSGDDALAKVEGVTVDRMTIDYNMPGMDGITLAKELQSRFADAKIALLTANIQDSIKAEADALGISFIQKPITEEKVNAFLQSE